METTPEPPSRQPYDACVNHPQVRTERRCAQCAQSFCGDCLVDIQSRSLCATCKGLSLREMQRRSVTGNKLANDSFTYSLVGILICGLVLEPLALLKGIQALKQHREDPTLPDRWKAVAGVIISSVVLAAYVIWLAFAILRAPSGG